MNRFSFSEITQDIMCQNASSDSCIKLRNIYNVGYVKSLKKSYMKNLKEALEKGAPGRNILPENKERLLFICDSREVARQACQIVRNYEKDQQKETMAEGQKSRNNSYEFGYTYDDEAVNFDMPGASPFDNNAEVLVVLNKENKSEKNSMSDVLMKLKMSETNGNEMDFDLDTSENVHIELGTVEDPDAAVNKVLGIQNENVSVWVKRGKSSDYLKKRLMFEGEYQVVELGTPTMDDLLSYAKDYLNVHGFKYKKEDLEKLLQKLISFRGELFTEKDIYTHLGRCMEDAILNENKTLTEEDLELDLLSLGTNSKEELHSVIGLENVKETFKRMVAAQKSCKTSRNRNIAFHRNLIFAGDPGTGKSKLARIYASLLSESGLGNGRFVDASKADIVGKYLGQTAHLLRELFKKAEGGVLFVDEASFLLSKDDFVKEAVIEFVRYMELYPETIVIFATYKKEAEALLDIDSGFRSRISKVITFENYTNDELWKILNSMTEMYGFHMSNGAKKYMCEYIEKIKKIGSFANAREVRKLLETSIEEYGLSMENSLKEPGKKDKGIITDTHVKLAAEYLLRERKEPDEKKFGFAV